MANVLPLPHHHGSPPTHQANITHHPQSLLRKTFSQVPVTALAFFQGSDYLFAGEDTHLVLYNLKPGHAVRIASVCVFAAQPIHGVIVLDSGCVLVWGAAQLATVDGIEAMLQGRQDDARVQKTTAPDWIYDAVSSPYDKSAAMLATAHNEIVQVKIGRDNAPVLGGIVASPSRPMLYMASLKWVDPDCVLVAAGTVFGEILVWKHHLSREYTEMLFVLSGHEGSIFGVHISDELRCADGSTMRMLVSCSDDRTVRVWDITERKGEKLRTATEFTGLRETGFGSTPEVQGAPDQAAFSNFLIADEMGHVSRIWGVKFAAPTAQDQLPESSVTIYSFGEDSTTYKWQLKLNVAQWNQQDVSTRRVTGTLKHKEIFSVHNGKHLWSHALVNCDGKTLVATGGADSKISLITSPTSDTEPTPCQSLVNLDLPEILPTLPDSKVLGPGREIFSRYDFITDDQVLTTTSMGRCLLGTFQPGLAWQDVHVPDEYVADLKSCYVLKTIGDGAGLMGTASGSLYHYCHGQGITRIATVPGKVVNILLLAEPNQVHTELIVNRLGTSDAQYFSIDWRTGTVLDLADVRGIDSRFVAMSAAKVKGDVVAIGSRHGWLSLLRRSGNELLPVLNMPSRSCRDAITGFVPLPARDGQTLSPYFLATSRDSKYRIYEIEFVQQDVQLVLRQEIAPPFGSVIEGGWLIGEPSNPELILYGFKGKNFLVWNETRREEIATVDCGGSHRSFTLRRHLSDPNRLRLGFTRVSKLSIYSQTSPLHRPLKQGTHGREVKALSSNGRWIATGAEDTTIRIWEFVEPSAGTDGDRSMRCLASMKLHVTGLQRVQWLGDDYLLSSGGYEEFFIWRIQPLESSYPGLGVVREAVWDDKSRHGDLRIMDFDACVCGNDGAIIITMVLSNSALKTYRYTRDGGFQLLAHMSYTGACLTQVRHLGVDENGLSALTASTDGHLATWEASFGNDNPSSHVLVQVVPLHQNSVKSLDLCPSLDGFLVLTGGDDNGLGITSLIPLVGEEQTRRFTVSRRGIVRKAHAAAINGVAVLERGEETLGVSVSNDQRVKVWRIGTERTELVADEYSGVADAGDVVVVGSASNHTNQSKLVVGGVGVEIWTL